MKSIEKWKKRPDFRKLSEVPVLVFFFGFLLEQCVIKKSNDDNSEDVGTTLMTLN
jgi:hypothetical protein